MELRAKLNQDLLNMCSVQRRWDWGVWDETLTTSHVSRAQSIQEQHVEVR